MLSSIFKWIYTFQGLLSLPGPCRQAWFGFDFDQQQWNPFVMLRLAHCLSVHLLHAKLRNVKQFSMEQLMVVFVALLRFCCFISFSFLLSLLPTGNGGKGSCCYFKFSPSQNLANGLLTNTSVHHLIHIEVFRFVRHIQN